MTNSCDDVKVFDTHLNPGTKGLVVLGEFSVGTVEGLDLDLVFADLHLVLLLQARDLGLVLALDLHDSPLQLIKSALAALAACERQRKKWTDGTTRNIKKWRKPSPPNPSINQIRPRATSIHQCPSRNLKFQDEHYRPPPFRAEGT